MQAKSLDIAVMDNVTTSMTSRHCVTDRQPDNS